MGPKVSLLLNRLIVSPDPELFPVMVAHQRFNCANDGAIYGWGFGGGRDQNIPLCVIEVIVFMFMANRSVRKTINLLREIQWLLKKQPS
jgi:hypothetical protein